MGDRADLIVIHALDLIQLVSNVTNLLERLDIKDVPVFYHERQIDDVGAAKLGAKLVIGLNVFVSLGQEVRETAEHLDRGGKVEPGCADGQQHGKDVEAAT